MEPPFLLIAEESVGHPNLLGIRHGEILYPALHVPVAQLVLVSQPVVGPFLSEGDLDTVLHFDIINFCETSDEKVDHDEGGVI